MYEERSEPVAIHDVIRKRRQHQQQFDDIIQPGHHKNGHQQGEDRAAECAAETQGHFLIRRAETGVSDDNAGQHAGVNSFPIDAGIKDVADHARQQRFQGVTNIVRISESIRRHGGGLVAGVGGVSGSI